MHRAEVHDRHAPQRGGGTGGDEGREDSIHHGSELEPERLQPGDETGPRARGGRDQVDRLQHRLAPDDEISGRRHEGAEGARRSLEHRARRRRPAPGYRREDDPRRRRNDEQHHLQEHQHRQGARHVSRPRPRAEAPQELQEQHGVRRAAHQRAVPHRHVPDDHGARRRERRAARGERQPGERRADILHAAARLDRGAGDEPERQRFRQRPRPAVPDGIQRRVEAAHRPRDGGVGRVSSSLAIEPELDEAPSEEPRRAGWLDFKALPMPHRLDEKWRFSPVKDLDLSVYNRALPVPPAVREGLIGRCSGLAESAGRMVFANDHLVEREVYSKELARKGVIWAPIEKAAVEHEEIFRRHFMTQEVVLGSKKFAALHKAMVKSGVFLYVPRGVEVELPIEVFHWLHGAGASSFPHTLLVAEEMSKVTLIDYFESADADAPGFACGVNDLHLGPGANLTYVSVQNWSRKALSFQINSTVVSRDASALSMNLNLGAAVARAESVSRLVGTGGRSDMLAVTVASGAQQFDQRTLQDHQQPNTTSDLLYKNVLSDKARTIFSGLIRVEPHAHRTDAYQKVRNLLLSDDAEANSMPGLEILADEVRCSHGATSGQIDEEELFYLLSRGIPPPAAKKLVTAGFLNEVVERLPSRAVKDKLRGLIEARQ